nr:hypothetical protein [Natronomonas gomsonensis]
MATTRQKSGADVEQFPAGRLESEGGDGRLPGTGGAKQKDGTWGADLRVDRRGDGVAFVVALDQSIRWSIGVEGATVEDHGGWLSAMGEQATPRVS